MPITTALLSDQGLNSDLNGYQAESKSGTFISDPYVAMVEIQSKIFVGIRMKINASCQNEADIKAKYILSKHVHLQANNTVKARRREICNSTHERKDANDILRYRLLEGYYCWSEKQNIEPITTVNPLAEIILFRTLAAISEHIVHCPERLAQELHHILEEKEAEDDVPFIIDLDRLQSGLPEIHNCDNINFDDINQCGAQNLKEIKKTWHESKGFLVIIDMVRNYYPIIFLKMWFLATAIYINWKKNNKMLPASEWQVKSLQYWKRVAQIDATVYLFIELVIYIYTFCVQERSLPTSDRSKHTLIGVLFGLVGFVGVFFNEFLTSSISITTVLSLYFLVYRLLFCTIYEPLFAKWFGSRKHYVRYGRPLWARKKQKKALQTGIQRKNTRMDLTLKVEVATEDLEMKEDAIDKCYKVICTPCRNFRIFNYQALFFWLLIFSLTLAIEYLMVAPIGQNLNYDTLCLSTCSKSSMHLSLFEPTKNANQCTGCIFALCFVFLLMIITSIVDMFILFNLVLSVVGGVKGKNRGLHSAYDINENNISLGKGSNDRFGLEKIFGSWKRGKRIWNALIQDLYLRDMMSKQQLNSFYIDPDLADEDIGHRKIQLNVLRVLQAKEGLLFFIKTVTQLAKEIRSGEKGGDDIQYEKFFFETLPSVSQVITTYSEDIMKTVEYLRQENGSKTNIEHLIEKYDHEWIYFERRMHSIKLYKPSVPGTNLLQDFISGTCMFSFELLQEVRLWASNRTQTVARTIRGALAYHKSLKLRLEWLAEDIETLNKKEKKKQQKIDSLQYNLHDIVELVISAQTYGNKGNEAAHQRRVDLEYLVKRFKEYPISVLYDYNSKKAWPEEKKCISKAWQKYHQDNIQNTPQQYPFQYATCIKQFDEKTGDLGLMIATPRRYPLRLGKGSSATQGKAANHTNALRKLWGHVTQVMDANMDGFLGEAFKLPFTTHKFLFRSGGKSDRKNVQFRIVGFREHIFTHPLGSVGASMASSEFAFGTIYQRVLADPLKFRMHYGHPDFFDTFWVLNRGGLSKASARINLSEDIFAGYNVKLRKEAVAHTDQLEWQKGRETVFTTASMFLLKVSAGAVAMLRTRDMLNINLTLSILERLSFFAGGVGYYFMNLLLSYSLFAFPLTFFFFHQANISIPELSALHSTLSVEWLFGFGFTSAVPLLVELLLEKGWAGVTRWIKEFFPSTLFYLFQNQIVAYSFEQGIITGEAKYQNTGRPAFFDAYSKKLAYLLYSNSHFSRAYILAMITAYPMWASNFSSKSVPLITDISILVVSLLWIITPIIFCPQITDGLLLKRDLKETLPFLFNIANIPDAETFFSFWSKKLQTTYPLDQLKTLFFRLMLSILHLLVVWTTCSFNFWKIILPCFIVYAFHFVVTIMWYLCCQKSKLLTFIWLVLPLAGFSIFPFVDKVVAMPEISTPNILLGVYFFYSLLLTFWATLIFVTSFYLNCRRQEIKQFENVSTKFMLFSLSYQIEFYMAFLTFLLQYLIHMVLLLFAVPYHLIFSGPKQYDNKFENDNERTDSDRVLTSKPHLNSFIPKYMMKNNNNHH